MNLRQRKIHGVELILAFVFVFTFVFVFVFENCSKRHKLLVSVLLSRLGWNSPDHPYPNFIFTAGPYPFHHPPHPQQDTRPLGVESEMRRLLAENWSPGPDRIRDSGGRGGDYISSHLTCLADYIIKGGVTTLAPTYLAWLTTLSAIMTPSPCQA